MVWNDFSFESFILVRPHVLRPFGRPTSTNSELFGARIERKKSKPPSTETDRNGTLSQSPAKMKPKKGVGGRFWGLENGEMCQVIAPRNLASDDAESQPITPNLSPRESCVQEPLTIYVVQVSCIVLWSVEGGILLSMGGHQVILINCKALPLELHQSQVFKKLT